MQNNAFSKTHLLFIRSCHKSITRQPSYLKLAVGSEIGRPTTISSNCCCGGGDMFGKKKEKVPEEKKAVCPICGYDCGDKSSLERHIDWAHKDQKNSTKS